MGQICDDLECFFEKSVAELIAHKGQRDCQRKSYDDAVNAEDKGVFEGKHKLIRLKELYEMLEADPGAVKDSHCWRIILEGHDKAKKRQVRKTEQEQGRGGEKHIKRCALLQCDDSLVLLSGSLSHKILLFYECRKSEKPTLK